MNELNKKKESNSNQFINNLSFLSKFLFILGDSKTKILIIFPTLLLAGFLDLLSIGMLAPLIGVIIDPDYLKNFTVLGIDLSFLFEKLSVFYFTLIIILMFVLRGALSILLNYLIVKFSANQDRILKNKLILSYLSMNFEAFLKRNRAEYVHSVNYMTSQFTSQVLMTFLNSLCSLIIGLMLISLLLYTNVGIFLLTISIFGIMIFFYDFILKDKIKLIGKNYNIFTTKMLKSINESIDGFQEIRAYGNKNFFIDKFKSSTSKTAQYQILNNLFSTMPRYIFETVIIIVTVISILFLLKINKFSFVETIQILAIFGIAAVRLLPLTNQLMVNLINIRHSKHTVDFLYNDLQIKNNNEKFIKRIDLNSLEFKNVSFNYSANEIAILNNVNFIINKNDFIGVKGDSGSGKTTLMNCILGLLKPKNGEVILNKSFKINEQNNDTIVDSAYIPQRLFFLDDTILSNITLSPNDERINLDHLDRCIKKVKLDKLIEDLPEGLDTIIGERGIRLSGGQSQRIALARAFYHNKKLLIMDESTNELDMDTEQSIINEIKSLQEDLTLIIISHRPQTLKFCNKIFKLDQGKLIEEINKN